MDGENANKPPHPVSVSVLGTCMFNLNLCQEPQAPYPETVTPPPSAPVLLQKLHSQSNRKKPKQSKESHTHSFLVFRGWFVWGFFCFSFLNFSPKPSMTWICVTNVPPSLCGATVHIYQLGHLPTPHQLSAFPALSKLGPSFAVDLKLLFLTKFCSMTQILNMYLEYHLENHMESR